MKYQNEETNHSYIKIRNVQYKNCVLPYHDETAIKSNSSSERMWYPSRFYSSPLPYNSHFISAQLSFMIASFSLTWSSPMLVKLSELDDNPLGYKISKSQNTLLASISILGSVFGSIIFGILATRLGRKTLLLILGLPLLVFYLVMAWCGDLWLLAVSRFITGISSGGVLTILPMYCGEIADAANRGILSASITVFVNIGLLIPYSLGPFIPYFWFHIVLAAFCAVFLISFFLISPESPYYLIKTNEDAARAVMLRIRQESDVPHIMSELKGSLSQKSDATFKDIVKSRALRKAFIMVLGAHVFQQLTGTSIVCTYSETIFKNAGSGVSAEVAPILVGVAQLIMTVLVSGITDRYPRKFLLTLSHLLVGLVQIPFGVYFFMKKQDYDVDSYNWVPVVCLITYVCVYNIGVGPILMAFLGELFPPEVKSLAISFIATYNWTGAYLLTALFNTLDEAIGIGILFWVFSLCSFVAIVFIKFVLIETKGKTLEEIQRELDH